MHFLSLFLFTVVVIIALNILSTSGTAVKTTTTKIVPTTTKVLAAVKTSANKPVLVSKINKKKKKKSRKKSRRLKPKRNPWKIPNVIQKKLFNDYKTILHTKITTRNPNITSTYQLEPAKYSSQVANNNILHHYLIKLPDSKYTHVIIGVTKHTGKEASINENSVSIRHMIYENLAAAEA